MQLSQALFEAGYFMSLVVTCSVNGQRTFLNHEIKQDDIVEVNGKSKYVFDKDKLRNILEVITEESQKMGLYD